MTVLSDRTIVAVYGTCRRGFHNHRFVADSLPVGAGRIAGLALYVDERSLLPMAVPSDTAEVRVECYALDAGQLAALDRLEGHPDWYLRTAMVVALDDGGPADAGVYVMQRLPPRALLVPGGDYATVARPRA